jgi:transglutaminase-like putative cysteine protease
MRFAVLHKLVSYLLVATALLALALSGELSTFAVAGAFGALVLSWFVEPRPDARWMARAWTIATITLLVYTFIDVLAGDAPTLVSATNFVVFLVVNKLFNRRSNRDYLQLYVLSLVTLVAAAAFNTDLSFALCFVLYITAATWSMILLHLRREMEENYLLRHTTPGAEAKRVEVHRILQSKRIVSGRFLFATSLLSLSVFLASGVLFFLFPRVGFGLMFGKSRGGISMAGFSDRIELGQFGRIRDNPAVVMRVELPEPAPLPRLPWRWRGISFDRYDGRTWRKEPSGFKQLPRGKAPRQFVVKRGVSLEGARTAKIYLEPLSDSIVLFAPGRLLAVELPEKRTFKRGDPRYARHDALGDYSLDGDPSQPVSYSLRFTLEVPDEERLRSAGGSVPRAIARRYLQLPPLSERVLELARSLTKNASTPYARATAVLEHLRKNYRYTLDLKRNDALEPLEDFLYEQKAGHCEYFSTAMAILLRAVGVPTRNVNGFLGGDYNPYGRFYTVRQGDAHSWVEVYLGDAGWVAFDPTPPDARWASREEGIWATLAAFVDSLRLKWYKYVIEYDLGKQVSIFKGIATWFRDLFSGRSGVGEMLREAARSPIIVSIALLVSAGAVYWFWRRRRRGAGASARRSRARLREVTELYMKLLDSVRALGFAKSAVETPRAFAARLRHERAPIAAPVLRFTDLYNAARFGGRELGAAEVSTLRTILRHLGRATPARAPAAERG